MLKKKLKLHYSTATDMSSNRVMVAAWWPFASEQEVLLAGSMAGAGTG